VRELGQGGSDRRFFRVSGGGTSRIAMWAPEGEARHLAACAACFAGAGLPVPRILSVRPGPPDVVVFEDLGDLSLYDWLKTRPSRAAVEAVYRRVLEAIRRLHALDPRQDGVPELPAFDREYFRWETDYFLDACVRGVFGREPADGEALRKELDRLAERAAALPRGVVHRDCQSRNILLDEGLRPRFIDFQGARIGPPEYDIASVLFDPYAPLDGDLRRRLVETAFAGRPGREAEEALRICRLQRQMQALGAFGFLSRRKGKAGFARFIRPALGLLAEVLAETPGRWPALSALVASL